MKHHRILRLAAMATMCAVFVGGVLIGRASATPNDPVIVNLGRRLIPVNLESGASLACSAQGQLVDTNGNGLVDSLRGRGACKENSGVHRLRIYSVQVQSDFADTWAPVVTRTADAVSGPQPSFVESFTPASRFCPPPGDFDLTYRVRVSFGVRSIDGSLAGFTMHSYQFQARAVDAALNDVC